MLKLTVILVMNKSFSCSFDWYIFVQFIKRQRKYIMIIITIISQRPKGVFQITYLSNILKTDELISVDLYYIDIYYNMLTIRFETFKAKVKMYIHIYRWV